MNGDSANRKKLIVSILLLSTSVLVLLLANAFLLHRVAYGQPDPIAITDSGRVIPVAPIGQAYATEARVLSYAEQCVDQAFSHDFVNYKQTFEESTACFTPSGVDGYANVMQPLLKKLHSERMVMTVAEKPFVVVRSGLLNGVYTWEVHGKLTLYMLGTNEDLPPEDFEAVIYVVRVPLQENVRGIALDSIDLEPYVSSDS